MTTEQKIFQLGDEKGVFEVGFRNYSENTYFVYNPLSRELEEIIGWEDRTVEGTDIERVQTRSGWYGVDEAIFAEQIGKLIYDGIKEGAYNPPVFIQLMNRRLLEETGEPAILEHGTGLGDYTVWTFRDCEIFYDGIDPEYFENGFNDKDPELEERADVEVKVVGEGYEEVSKLITDLASDVRKWWFNEEALLHRPIIQD